MRDYSELGKCNVVIRIFLSGKWEGSESGMKMGDVMKEAELCVCVCVCVWERERERERERLEHITLLDLNTQKEEMMNQET